MSRPDRTWLRWLPWLACCFAVGCLGAHSVFSSTIVLKDGRRLQGRIGKTAGLAVNPLSPNANSVDTIRFIDDGLRRVFFPAIRIGQLLEADAGEPQQNIIIKQNVARDAGSKILRVGPIVNIADFDKRGHRTLTMLTGKGPIAIVQGITQITPTWTKVEAMRPTAARR